MLLPSEGSKVLPEAYSPIDPEGHSAVPTSFLLQNFSLFKNAFQNIHVIEPQGKDKLGSNILRYRVDSF